MKATAIMIFMVAAILLLVACGGDIPTSQIAGNETGKEIYAANCAACHGLSGEGEPNWKVPDANGIYPAPPHDDSGHTWHHPDALLLQIIQEGSGVPNSKMPAYGAILTPAQSEEVLGYIKSFWGQDEQKFQQQMTEQWKALNK